MMTRWMYGSAAALALTLGTTPAQALTATEAWEAWKGWISSTGSTVTTTGESAGNGSVAVTGITLTNETESTSAVVVLGDVTFTENGDGVTVDFPEGYSATFKDTGFEPVEGTLSVNYANPTMRMADAAGGTGIDYVFGADTAEFSLDSIIVDGEAEAFDLTATLQAVQSNFTTDASVSFLNYTIGASSLDVSLVGEDLDEGAAVEAVVSFGDFSSTGTGANFSAFGDHPEDLNAALADGLAFDFGFSSGGGSIAVNASETRDAFQMNAEVAGTSGRLAMDASQLISESTYSGLAFTASGSEIPFPQVTGTLGEMTTNLLMPLMQGEAAQDFGLRLVLGDVTMGEEIWSLFDPAGVFPRDPATILADLAGKATVLIDIFDEEAMVGSDAPGLLEAVTLNELRVAAGGAELTGDGAFTFDNSDMTTFDGIPAPDGAVNLRLSGGNALLDILVTMGLLPQDQAMMARMMTGMVAKPGEGPDTLVSEIAVRPDGTILANGAPLPF